MWTIPILTILAGSVEPVGSDVNALAMVRIVPTVKASEQDWISSDRRMERVITDERGRALLLRTVEHE